MVGGGSAQQSQAGMEQRFHQQAGKGTLASVGSKNQQRANDTVRESVIGAVDVGLDGSHRRFRSAGMLSQTDSYVLGAKQESEHLHAARPCRDRKSTRLNSSHVSISYAVFCLKKKI